MEVIVFVFSMGFIFGMITTGLALIITDKRHK